MTVYIPTYQNTQKVSENDVNLPFENNYQNFNKIFSSQSVPYIKSGLNPTIDVAGLVTVTAGVFLGNLFDNTDDALLPPEGMQVINSLDVPTNIQVLAVSDEFGLIVLRETLVTVQGLDESNNPIDVGINVIVSLVYLAGGVSNYPAILPHDTVVVGVKSFGGAPPLTYELDFSQRVQDTQVYNTSTLQNQLWGDPDFENYSLSITSPTVLLAGNSAIVSPSWTIETTGSAVDLSQQAVSTSDMLVIDGAPSTNLRILQAVGAANSEQFMYETVASLSSVANRWFNASFWRTLTAGAAVTFAIQVRQNAVVLFTSTDFSLPASATFSQIIQEVFIPINLANVQSSTAPVQIGIVFKAPNTNYQLNVNRLSLGGGKTFQPVQSRVGGKTQTDLALYSSNFFVASGPVNAYVLELPGALTITKIPQYFNGLMVEFIPNLTNLAAPTVEIGTLGSKSVSDEFGNPLISGELRAFALTRLVFDASSDSFKLIRPAGTAVIEARLNGLGVILGTATGIVQGNITTGAVIDPGSVEHVIITFPVAFANTNYNTYVSIHDEQMAVFDVIIDFNNSDASEVRIIAANYQPGGPPADYRIPPGGFSIQIVRNT